MSNAAVPRESRLSQRFGRFELQPAERRRLEDGQPVALGARAFDLLALLVERAGQLVAKNELLTRAWSGLVVEENNLQVQVSTLPKLLGQSAVATIPGRGYRFELPVERRDAIAPDAGRMAYTLLLREGDEYRLFAPLALLAALQGRWAAAARIIGHDDAVHAHTGEAAPPHAAQLRARLAPLLAAVFPAPELARLRAEGAAMRDEQVFGQRFCDSG